MKKKHVTIAFALFGIAVSSTLVLADVIPTSVTVGNTAPAFTVTVAENPASDGTTPTNEGANVTFEATATDGSNEDYYLAICQTNAITAVNGGAPTCPGGTWSVSSATTSGNQATTTYTTLNANPESNSWFAFVCDGNASNALCSASSQGAGASGSPFKVNHDPAFTAAANDGPANPGDTVTFTTTASDPDTDTVADTVSLVVCKTAGLTGTACNGGGSDTWCTSSAAASNPTCNFSLDAVLAHGSLDAFVYVYDNHGLVSSGAAQGTNQAITVNDTAPVVSAITLNGGSDISLTEGSTTAVAVTATVSDDNSCQDLTGVTSTIYRSGVTYANCDTGGESNNNTCYAIITCSVSGASCTGATDGSADYTCSASIQYHADPTDATTEYPAENWLSTVIGTDGSTSVNTQIGTGVEVLSLIGYDVAGSINYGSLTVGQSNDPLDRTTNVSATGNVGLDIEVSGTNMADGGNTIAVGNQEYALAISTAYGAGTDLTTSATESEINIAKTTVTSTDENADVYWGLLIPGGTQPGSYTGTNTITALKGEVGQW